NDLRVPTFLFSVICDRTAMPPGAPPRMKRGRRYSVPGQYVRMRSTGLVVRSCSDWCPEPVTALDLDTCWHHPLSPASLGKWSTQGSLSRSGYPASPPTCVEVSDGRGVSPMRRLGCP